MNSYRQLFLRLLWIALGVAAINVVFGPVMDARRDRCVNAEAGQLNVGRAKKAPVLILGSSRAKRQYDDGLLEKLWNVPVFNGGYPGQGIPFTRVEFELLTKNGYRPKLVIVEVTPFDAEMERAHAWDPWYFESEILRALPRPGDPTTLARTTRDWKTEILMRLPTYRYGEKTSVIFKDKARDGEGTTFAPLPERESKLWPARVSKVNPSPWLYANLSALVDEVRAAGAEIVLVWSPFHGNPDHTAVSGPAGRVAREKNVRFLEISDREIPELSDEKYFFDDGHLALEGSRLFTRKIADLLSPEATRASGVKR